MSLINSILLSQSLKRFPICSGNCIYTMIVSLISAGILSSASTVLAITIHVPADSTTIQAGINGTTDGDTVMVADGTYTGDGNRDIDFLGKAIVVMSENGAENCVIDCEGDWANEHRGFYFHSGEGSTSMLKGFTIKNGYADSGGGIYCADSSPTITGNTIKNNMAQWGCGIYSGSSSPTITGNTIKRNEMPFDFFYDGAGGGIYCPGGSPIIKDNTISGNRLSPVYPGLGWGGGICCIYSSPIISGNIITGNSCGFGWGGGIYCGEDSYAIITGNTISGNDGPFGDGIGIRGVSLTIMNSILWDNGYQEILVEDGTPIVTYSDIQGGWQGEGNIDEDPRFFDNYHLRVNSPCIDAGNPSMPSRPWGGFRLDMGAYDYDKGFYYDGQNIIIKPYANQLHPWTYEDVKLLASDGDGGELFGYSVSIFEDVALVGARWDDENGSASGSAYVFRYNPDTGTWTEEQKLLASDGDEGDYFGNHVSICGEVAVIGAVWDDEFGWRSGSAYVFRYDPDTETWTEEGKLHHVGESDYFGCSVSISGDVALVGAMWDDFWGESTGAAYIFRFDHETGDWTEEQKLLASDGESGDYFGEAVSLFGNVAVVGAKFNEANDSHSGSAYVFRYNPNTGTWIEEEKIIPSDGDYDDLFGQSVFLSGEILVVGAPSDDDNGINSGSAYLFRYDSGTWVEKEKLLPEDGYEYDRFGESVSISGDVALVGIYSGSAYVFHYESQTDKWIEEVKLLSSDDEDDDSFGHSVSISNDVALVGAYLDDDNGNDSGSAYVFHLAENGWVSDYEMTIDPYRGLVPISGAPSVDLPSGTYDVTYTGDLMRGVGFPVDEVDFLLKKLWSTNEVHLVHLIKDAPPVEMEISIEDTLTTAIGFWVDDVFGAESGIGTITFSPRNGDSDIIITLSPSNGMMDISSEPTIDLPPGTYGVSYTGDLKRGYNYPCDEVDILLKKLWSSGEVNLVHLIKGNPLVMIEIPPDDTESTAIGFWVDDVLGPESGRGIISFYKYENGIQITRETKE